MSGGGGVGLFGQGSDGVGVGAKTYSGGQTVAGGGGGSGGGTGGITSAVIFSYDVEYGGLGGYYGGAGGRGYDPNGSTDYDQPGGNGAVRIIWGAGRAFPSTNTGNY
jgi:hypothetical protein